MALEQGNFPFVLIVLLVLLAGRKSCCALVKCKEKSLVFMCELIMGCHIGINLLKLKLDLMKRKVGFLFAFNSCLPVKRGVCLSGSVAAFLPGHYGSILYSRGFLY